MRVVIIHQYFRTPQEGGAIRSYYLAKGLLDHGHEVEVITAHNDKASTEYYEDIKVHYLPVYYDNKLGAISRIWAFIKFVLAATNKAYRIPEADVNYVISTPLSVGLIALFLKRVRNTPYIFEIGDLWPEAPIQLGYIRNPVLRKLLRNLEKRIYNKAQSIVAMSPDIEQYVHRSQPKNKVVMIPNMADCEYYKPVEKLGHSVEKYDVKDKFVISYIGTAGRANHLEYLVEAAKACEVSLPQVQFLLASSGRELENIKQLIGTYELTNIRFVDYLDRAGVKELMSVTDAVYVSFANVPILSSGSPNKFFDGLAAGKLTITNFGGWTESVIERSKCGFSYDPEEVNTFVEKLTPYLTSAELLNQTQSNARQLAEQCYSRKGLSKEWGRLFD